MTLQHRSEFTQVMHRLFDPYWEPAWLRIEEFFQDGMFVVRAELPGIDPVKDLTVSVKDDVLHIHVEKRVDVTRTGARGYRSEFSYGEFARDVAVHPGTNEADVAATYRDGVLEIRVPTPAVADEDEHSVVVAVQRA